MSPLLPWPPQRFDRSAGFFDRSPESGLPAGTGGFKVKGERRLFP